MEAKSGEDIKVPGLMDTFLICLKMIFLSEKSLFRLIIDSRLNYNLVTIFLLTILVPYKPFKGDGVYDVENIFSGLIMTFFFIVFLYIFLPKKNLPLSSFLRLFVSFEVISIFSPISFLLKKEYLIFFSIFLLLWYLFLSVFVFSKISGLSRTKSVAFVIMSYILSNFIILF
ncbi:MAG: hypothetical protein LDL13_05615, partial [Calditerrivibrio sp.]|nr:hypothetical protein [Calditerrivibrio sp.]MCA1980139.1 hypothetical protein [Calditerrivibrio sp.]